ncbi:MAG: helix-turn-helix domain-containing protein [Gammaproteobacteria bacterium]|nr:helix-turn-helix domain-containing protein [Gammaproteobacteria bacterium]
MTSATPQAAPVNRSLGALLKGRRQELKLAVQDIASQMRLDPRIIEALESECYDGLPAPLYVRGYIRGYAKILKLNANALVELYDSDAPSEPPEIIPEVKHPSQTSSSDKPVKVFTYLVTFTLVILLIAWWQSSFVVKTVTPRTESAEPPLNNVTGAARQPTEPQYTVAPAQDPQGGAYTAPAEEPPGENEASAALQLEAAVGAAAGSIVGAVPGPDRIVFRLNADSWVEVFDARGERLFMSLARAGEVLSLSGTAPFSVLLGYAQGVAVEFNGRPFDPAPYSRSGIARFTLSN